MVCLTIIGGRGSGKTKALINEVLKDPNGILVVPTNRDKQKAIRYHKVPVHKVISVDDPELVSCGGNLYIDRIDTILFHVFKKPIRAIALNSGEVKVL